MKRGGKGGTYAMSKKRELFRKVRSIYHDFLQWSENYSLGKSKESEGT